MMDQLRYILRRFGQHASLNDTEIQIFLQPLPDNSKAAPYAVTSLGTVDDRRWVAYSLEHTCPGDKITWDGTAFVVQTSEQFALGDTLLAYWRAVLIPAKEVAS